MHALGHAALALAAGACAQVLTSGAGALAPGALGSTSLPVDALSLGVLGLTAAAVKSVGGVLAAWSQARLSGEVGTALRIQVLEAWLTVHRLQRPRHGDQREASSGTHAERVAALTARVREVELGLQTGLLGGARAVAQLVPLAALLVWLSPKLALAALFVFAPFSLALGGVRKKWKRAHERAMKEGDALLEAADEAVRHADLWKTYGAGHKARATVARLGASLARHAARVDATTAAIGGANEVLGAIALLLALLAARAGWLGEASGGTLLSFAVAFFLAYKPLRDLTDARLALARARLAFDALSPMLASPAVPVAREDDARVFDLAPLEVRDLELPRGALPPLSLRVAPGEIVAIVGPTGAGKTTLLRTLLGLEAPASGEIRYGGAPLDDAPPGPRHRPFAWVPQDAPLLADTLAANVALGETTLGPREALAPLGAAHLVDALSGARLGAGGRAVSGGERQWIALARAVATRAPVLLLDEPTSGLDAASQRAVLKAIESLKGHRTVVMVTHRPEPLAIADQVCRLAPTIGAQRVTQRSSSN